MTIEKDYVLSWILAGIAHHPSLCNQWIFKGGTCLKKCYFSDYRFSEDLDFTVSNPELLDTNLLRAHFTEIADWIYAQSEIEIVKRSMVFKIRPRGSIEGRLPYRGPMQPRTNYPRIKLDLTCDEIRVLPDDQRPLLHGYSDDLSTTQITCYSIEELFAEKLRALFQRMRPRDLYDVVHLAEQNLYPVNQEKLGEVIKEKFSFKDLPSPTLEMLEKHPHRDDLPSQWKRMLEHQLPQLESIESYWEKLPSVLDRIGVAVEIR